MQDEQFLKATQPVPEHLRGTREGLFHILNKCVGKSPGATLSQRRDRPHPVEPVVAAGAPATGCQSILQDDDFHFSY